METFEPPYIIMVTYSGALTVGNGLHALQKLDHRINCIQENPKELRKDSEWCSSVNIHCNSIYIVKRWGQPRCQWTDKWINTMWVRHIHSGKLFNLKKGWMACGTCWDMGEAWKSHILRDGPDTKGKMIPFHGLSGSGKFVDMKAWCCLWVLGGAGGEEEGMNAY